MTTTTETGRQAETTAVNFLLRDGFTIVERNWRTRWCEIDIIASKGQILYFIEVKYRATHSFGSGLEYITPRKLQQMHFAADFWVASHAVYGCQVRLAAIEVTGAVFEVTAWIDDIF